jgi:hypothetical protein
MVIGLADHIDEIEEYSGIILEYPRLPLYLSHKVKNLK